MYETSLDLLDNIEGFVERFEGISSLLTKLLKKYVKFKLTEAWKAKRLTTATVLTIPDETDKFVIYSNDCSTGIGSVLMQNDKVVYMFHDSWNCMSATTICMI